MSSTAKQFNTATYNIVAAGVLLAWDHCITLDAEVQLMWRTKWNWVTSLFITIRYLALTNIIVGIIVYTNVPGTITPSHAGCVAWFWFDVSSVFILIVCVDILLATRVYAIYSQSRAILAGLVLLALGSNVARITILVVAAHDLDIQPTPPNVGSHLPACYMADLPPALSYAWIPEFIPETIVFLLVSFKLLRSKMRSKVPASKLLLVLIRDGTLVFLLIFGLLVLTVFGLRNDPELGLIAITWLVPALGFCSSRLILNLRSAAKEQGTERPLQIQNFELDPVSSCVLPTYDVSVTSKSTQTKRYGIKANTSRNTNLRVE